MGNDTLQIALYVVGEISKLQFGAESRDNVNCKYAVLLLEGMYHRWLLPFVSSSWFLSRCLN